MSQANSRWQTHEIATTFLEGVRGAIPGADLQMAVIGKIVQLWCETPARIMDLGCGDGILGRYLLGRFPSTAGVFVDFSDPMLKAAAAHLQGLPQASVVKADFGHPAWLAAVAPYRPFDVIVSGFAIHHQPDDRKRELYGEIYDLLSSGGVFLNLEHVSSQTPAGEALFDDFFVDHLFAFHADVNFETDRAAIAEKYYQRPDKSENILAPLELQCQWLQELGFQDVDCFFKTFELALFGGRKPGH